MLKKSRYPLLSDSVKCLFKSKALEAHYIHNNVVLRILTFP